METSQSVCKALCHRSYPNIYPGSPMFLCVVSFYVSHIHLNMLSFVFHPLALWWVLAPISGWTNKNKDSLLWQRSMKDIKQVLATSILSWPPYSHEYGLIWISLIAFWLVLAPNRKWTHPIERTTVTEKLDKTKTIVSSIDPPMSALYTEICFQQILPTAILMSLGSHVFKQNIFVLISNIF